MGVNYVKYFEYLIESGTITESEIGQISKEVFKAAKQTDESDEKIIELIRKKCQEYISKNRT